MRERGGLMDLGRPFGREGEGVWREVERIVGVEKEI
jgi:hypothetical protein